MLTCKTESSVQDEPPKPKTSGPRVSVISRDIETFEELRTLSGHKGGVWAVAYSPDGTRIYSGSEDQTVKVWDSETGAEIGSAHV
jgi:WD40 repeat protein